MHANTHSGTTGITAIILAGGFSSRMGQNKALIEWQQRPFIEHIIERLRPQVNRIVINTNNSEAFANFGLPLINDPFADRRGPLAGILAAINYSSTPLTLVVPCDNPLLPQQLVERLAAALISENTSIAYAASGTDNHYLYALLRSDLRDELATHMNTHEYAVHRWYAIQKTSRVDFSDQSEYFRNINCAEDLAQLPHN